MRCDKCDKRAIVNIQRVWLMYRIDDDGDYGQSEPSDEWNDQDEPTGENNVHLCARHAREEGIEVQPADRRHR